MQVKLVQRNIGSKRRFLAVSVNGDVMRSMPTNGWLTEAAAKKWAAKNGHTIVSVERMKDSVDAIREKYQDDSQSTEDLQYKAYIQQMAKTFYNMDKIVIPMSKKRNRELDKIASDINKLIDKGYSISSKLVSK